MRIRVLEGNTLETAKGVMGPGQVCELPDGGQLVERGVAVAVGPDGLTDEERRVPQPEPDPEIARLSTENDQLRKDLETAQKRLSELEAAGEGQGGKNGKKDK